LRQSHILSVIRLGVSRYSIALRQTSVATPKSISGSTARIQTQFITGLNRSGSSADLAGRWVCSDQYFLQVGAAHFYGCPKFLIGSAGR
jgi:hypothetical protein